MPPSTVYYCDNCGAANRPQARFCIACGEPMAAGSSSGAASSTGLLPSQSLLAARYLIISRLGQGGMGAVYKAADTQLGNRLVAVKGLSQKGLDQQEVAEAAEAFRREAHLLAGLFHHHLPRIYDHFDDGGRWYLVMDYIEGETLEDYLDQAGGILPVEEVIDIGIQLCTVLSYLHSHQPPVIFRDLKPANVMHTPDGDLYLIDFGIARFFKPGKTKDTAAYGSDGYAAPEQYGKGQTTPRSDIYSLGATLHHLLSGSDPAQSPFHFASLSGAGMPAGFATLIAQMLDIDANKRPASVTLVKQRLQDITAPPQRASSSAIPPVLPKKLTPADQKTLKRLRDEGGRHFDARRFDMALSAYEQVNSIDPTDVDAHFNRGVALACLGRHEEALSAYNQAIHFDPEYALSLVGKGDVLAHLGRYAEALATYELILHFSPEGTYANYQAWERKSKVFQELGRSQEAQKAGKIAERSRALWMKASEKR